jgi:hypothetical protein
MLYVTTLEGKVIELKNWEDYNLPILNMQFQINEKERIVLEGFEAYLRLKENMKGVFHKISGVSKILLCGKIGNNVNAIEIDCIKLTMTKKILPFDEVYQGKAVDISLWKTGCLDNPRIYVTKI